MEEIALLLKELEKRIENLERLLENKEVIIPPDGKLVVDNRASDPTGSEGRIYMNTTTSKLRVYTGGLWRNVDTTP